MLILKFLFTIGLLYFLGSLGCDAQRIITTFAGTDTTYPESPFPANAASFGRLVGNAVSPSGEVYFVSRSRSMILKFTPASGTVSVVAGIGIGGYSGDGEEAVRAQLNNPQGITFDAAGNLFVGDNSNGAIRKIDTQGRISTVAKFPDVIGVAVGPNGVLYATNYYQIVRVNSDGTLTPIAGSFPQGYGGDGGPATAARLQNASALLFDAAGNLVFADSGNNRIRRIDTKGIITTIAGNGQGGAATGGPATSTAVTYPIGMALDAGGNLYTASFQSGQLMKIDTGGQLSVLNTNPTNFYLTAPGPVADAQMIPTWPAFTRNGDMYLTDFSNILWKITSDGMIQVAAGFAPNFELGDGGPAALAGLKSPSAVAVAADGSVLIAERYGSRIRRVAPAGTISTAVGNGRIGVPSSEPPLSAPLHTPSALAADSLGNIYFVCVGKVFKVTSGGTLSLFYPGRSDAAGITVDGQGNLLVATGNQVVRVAANGTGTVVAGAGPAGFSGDGGPAGSATLNGPRGVAVDSAGNIYVSDTGNLRIRKITPLGTISTIGGGGTDVLDGVPGTQSSTFPYAIASDKAGNVYFAELFQGRIRQISVNGTITTIAGNGGWGFSGDGGLSQAAEVNEPEGIAVDGAGNVYIADEGNNRIRKILVTQPAMGASSTQLTLSAPSAGAPAEGSVKINTSAQGLGYALSFSTKGGGNWLSGSLVQGRAPGAFVVNADPKNLAPNKYEGTVTITSPYASPAVITVGVTFDVTAGIPPKLAVANGPVNFSLLQGADAANSPLTVLNKGGGSISYTAATQTATGGSWLSISASNGTATASAPSLLTVIATPGALGPGTYTGSVTIKGSSNDPGVVVPITLSISSGQPQILLSQNGLTLSAVAGGGAPLTQSFGILNTGQGSMSWSATANTLAGGPWLRIDKSDGVVALPNTDVSLVKVGVNTTGLAPGTYYGQISVTVPGAPNSPQAVSVALNVLPAGSSPGAEVSPTGLIFVGDVGSSPASQVVTISNPQPTEITFGGSFFTVPTGGNWLKFLPTNATVQPNVPLSMVVQPDYTNLKAGTYDGFISIGFADGSTRSIHVTAVVAPKEASLKSERGATACGPVLVQPLSLTEPGSTAVIGTAVSLQVRAVDACKNPLVSANGAVGATFSNGDAAVNLVHVGNGNWSGTWTPRNSASTKVQVRYDAFQSSGTTLYNGSGNLMVNVQSGKAAPLTFGAANAASGLGAVVSPGGLVSIYGEQFAGSAAVSSDTPFPTTLNGTQVLIGGIALPLRYVGPEQINAQVPFGLAIDTRQQLQVQNGDTISVPQSMIVAAAQPAVYTQDQSGKGNGVIVNFRTSSLVTPGQPAQAGDTITIYCNGLGAVNPPVATGVPAPSAEPLARTANGVTVTIGGVAARVDFAGLAPGFPDLYQVNAVIPAGTPLGDAVPIVLATAGQSSPAEVTIAIR